MESLIYIVVLLVDFISLRIPNNNDDFPDPTYPNIMINLPFYMVRLIRWMAGVKDWCSWSKMFPFEEFKDYSCSPIT